MIMVVMIVAMIMIPMVVLTILDRTARDSCGSKYQRSQHPQNIPFHSWSIIDSIDILLVANTMPCAFLRNQVRFRFG